MRGLDRVVTEWSTSHLLDNFTRQDLLKILSHHRYKYTFKGGVGSFNAVCIFSGSQIFSMHL